MLFLVPDDRNARLWVLLLHRGGLLALVHATNKRVKEKNEMGGFINAVFLFRYTHFLENSSQIVRNPTTVSPWRLPQHGIATASSHPS